jgi:hypothetical protein
MITSKDGMFLKIIDNFGHDVKFVSAIDKEAGFILVYTDTVYDQEKSAFILNTLKQARIYGTFTLLEDK